MKKVKNGRVRDLFDGKYEENLKLEMGPDPFFYINKILTI